MTYIIRQADGTTLDCGDDTVLAAVTFMRRVILPNVDGTLIEAGGLDGLEERIVTSHEHDPDAILAKVHALRSVVADAPEAMVPDSYRKHCEFYAYGRIDEMGELGPFRRADAVMFGAWASTTPAPGERIQTRWEKWAAGERLKRGV